MQSILKSSSFCLYIFLCFFVRFSTQTNNHCAASTPLTILPFSSNGIIPSSTSDLNLNSLGLDTSLNLNPLHLDTSITAGAWFTMEHLLPISLAFNICPIDDEVELTAYLFRGTCDHLVLVDFQDCCTVDFNVDILPNNRYYLFIAANIEIDFTIDVNIFSSVNNTLCVNPLEIVDTLTAGTTLGIVDDLITAGVVAETHSIWYFLYSGSNDILTASTCSPFGQSNIDVTIDIYTGCCDSLELLASIDLDCSNVLNNHATIHLEINRIYFISIRARDNLFADFQLFTSIVSSELPEISVDVVLGESGVVCSAVDNILHVSGSAVAGLRYELLVADLLPIVVEVGIDGLFDVNVDISTLQEGEFSIRLIERGSGRSCEKKLINEVLSLLSGIVDSVISASIINIGGLL